jgi:hypothetical protein
MDKTCSKCKIEKNIGNFYKDKQKSDGFGSQCKKCIDKSVKNYVKLNRKKVRWHSIKYTSGLSKEQYGELMILQENRCALCGKNEEENGKLLCVDHDHNTNYIRGLLCVRCNFGLGYFMDNKEILQKAINYLENNYSIKKFKIRC